MVEKFEKQPGIVVPEAIGLTSRKAEFTLPKNIPGRLHIIYVIKGKEFNEEQFANVRFPFAEKDIGFAGYGASLFSGSVQESKYPTYSVELVPSQETENRVYYLSILARSGLWIISMSDGYENVMQAHQSGTLTNIEILFHIQLSHGVPE